MRRVILISRARVYSIIEALLEHTSVTGDLIALMAQVLDQDTTKALTNTPTWAAYLTAAAAWNARAPTSNASRK
jgi:hypothetical protein